MESGIGQLRKGGKGIGRFAVALIVAYVITVLALFGIAFVMLKLQPDAGTTELLILAVYVLSCFAGGWYAGRRAGQRKFLQGLLVGVLYFAILFLISGMGERRFSQIWPAGGLGMPSVRSRWHAWRHAGLKTAEKFFLFNYKMV